MTTKQLPQTLSPSPAPSKLHLTKAARRAFRTVSTEARLFLARPLRRRPWTLPFILILAFALLLLLTVRLLSTFAPLLLHYEPQRESHFSHNAHAFLPRPAKFETVRARQCSWHYVEFSAKDGRHLDGFFNNGNAFLEEFLRATQSSMRAFCALAVEADPAMSKLLNNVRKARGRKASHFDVFTRIVPAAVDETEQIKFRDPETNNFQDTQLPVTAVNLKQLIENITFPIHLSGAEVPNMNTARGNGNKGAVILRFNQLTVREALWYLDLMEADSSRGVLCQRVDRVILDFQKMRLSNDTAQEVDDRNVERDWKRIVTQASNTMFKTSDDLSDVVRVANIVNNRAKCRAIVYVLDSTGNALTPPMLTERNVHYSILAGQPTFNERVAAQTNTWMKAVPQDRVTIFTNVNRSAADMRAARTRSVAVVEPHDASLEKHLSMMQSWSHLVRTRETWDRVMQHDESIKWLGLVDDDTFVFPGAVREYLSSFDARTLVWGGSGEQARIDNGDAGEFAQWLRTVHEKYGGKHCYMQSEQVPKNLEGHHVEYGVSEVLNGRRVARKVSHMCHDTFCRVGCPAVPQGAAIFVSRALVQALRPHIEACERDTAKLCKNCGSQRLFMCVNRYTKDAHTLLTRGVCRSPWKLEHRERFPFVLTFHGFNRYRGVARSTNSLHGDMVELWRLGKSIEDEVENGSQSSYQVPMPRVADMIACYGKGQYVKGHCVTEDGQQFEANDGGRGHGGHARANHKPKQEHH